MRIIMQSAVMHGLSLLQLSSKPKLDVFVRNLSLTKKRHF